MYNGILFSHIKGGNPAMCDNTEGPRGHYAKGNKPDRERQIPYDLIYGSRYFHHKLLCQKHFCYKRFHCVTNRPCSNFAIKDKITG